MEDAEDPALNALHGSDSLESAEREVNFFFPKQQTLAVIKPDTSSEERGSSLPILFYGYQYLIDGIIYHCIAVLIEYI